VQKFPHHLWNLGREKQCLWDYFLISHTMRGKMSAFKQVLIIFYVWCDVDDRLSQRNLGNKFSAVIGMKIVSWIIWRQLLRNWRSVDGVLRYFWIQADFEAAGFCLDSSSNTGQTLQKTRGFLLSYSTNHQYFQCLNLLMPHLNQHVPNSTSNSIISTASSISIHRHHLVASSKRFQVWGSRICTKKDRRFLQTQ
jgi:hypothetical protein